MRRALWPLSILFALSIAAQPVESNGPAFSRDAVGVKSFAAAPRLLEQAAGAPAITMASAYELESDALLALQAWNDADRLPLQNGFSRSIHDGLSVRLDGVLAQKGSSAHARGLVSASDRGTLVWSGSVRVEGAHRVRLHLTNVVLPEGATLWVYGAGTEPIGFDRDLLYAGSLYTPSVNGPVVHLEVEIPTPKGPADVASFEIRDLIELVAPASLRTPRPEPQPEDVPSCLIDATCTTSGTFTSIAAARAAMAQLQYVKDAGSYVCSGGLINDKVVATFVPYLLTANHCFDSQASASSLESYFDYKTTSCGGAFPSFPTPTLGATLLATSPNTDFTLVRLNSLPAGRTLMGWNTVAPTSGGRIHRVSHPFPDAFSVPAPQRYSSHIVDNAFGTCSSKPLTSYIYSTGGTGGTYGGSSGSPVMNDSGQIVGQLFGACGSNLSAGCDNVQNAKVDGALSATFPAIQQFINVADGGGGGQTCVPSSTKVCLGGDRFGISVAWKTTQAQGTATAIEYTPDSALFWFFSATNIEMLLKTINGCGLNNRYWVFAAATTDVEYTITVTDHLRGNVKTYFHAQGTPAPAITDTEALATCP